MTREPALAVLDVGKSAARVVGVTEDGRIAFSSRHACRNGTAVPYPHLDVDDTFTALCDGLAELGRGLAPTGVMPVAHGAAAALIGDGALALPVMDYEAEPPEAVSRTYDDEASDFSETLSPRLPAGLNLGRQIAWMEAAAPDRFAAGRHLVPFAQYWAWRLCGTAASEVSSLGCHTDLWNPATRSYSRLARRHGWDKRFAPIRPAGEVIGTLEAGIARRLGLPEGLPVHCGVHDSNAAAWRCIGPGDGSAAILSTGTWFVAMRPGGPVDALDPAIDMLANVAPDFTPVPSIRFMGGREAEAIAPAASLPLADTAALVRVLASGAMALPGFATAGGPFHDRPGRIETQSVLDAAARAALAILYVALVADWCLDRLGATRTLHVTGPFAGLPLFGAVLAALRPDARILADTVSDGTPLGAALVARGRRGDGSGFHAATPFADPRLVAYRSVWRKAVAR
jgi:L-fuculokinase